MGYAFISYSTKNQTVADAMRKLLDKKCIATWMAPYDIPVGKQYVQVINQAIKGCDCVVLMLSEAAQNSVWVSKEIERAINYKKMIIPVKVEDLVLNDEFEMYISTSQIIAIKGFDEKSEEVQKILSSVEAACGHVTETEADSEEKKGRKKSLVNRKESRKRIFWFVLLVMAAVLLSALGDSHDSDDNTQNHVNTQTKTEDIPFINMSETEQYQYPFRGFSGFSFKKETFLMEDKDTENFSMIETSTGKRVPGNYDIEWNGCVPKDIWVLSSEDTAIMYFYDNLKNEILIYDSMSKKWLTDHSVKLEFTDTESAANAFAGIPNLSSDIIDEDDIFIFVYDFKAKDSKEGAYSKIIHVTPDGEVSYKDISQLHISEVVMGFEREVSENEIPVFVWDSGNKPVLLDLLTGQLIDVHFNEIYEKYMPYANSNNQIVSSDGRYIKRIKGYQANEIETAYTEFSVWNMETGKEVFKERVIGNGAAFFSGKDEMLFYREGELLKYNLENGSEHLLLNEEYFNGNHEFEGIPFAFYYSDKLNWCIWDLAVSKDEGGFLGKVVITDLGGNVLYRYDDIEIPFEGYYTDTYVGDNFILHLCEKYESVDELKGLKTTETAIYAIPLKVSYSINQDGEIQLKSQ